VLRVFASPFFHHLLAPLLVVALLLVYGWRFLVPLLFDPSPRADDFQDYLFASRQLITGGDLYADFDRTHVPWDWSLSSGYLYPPPFAALLIPLTLLPGTLAVRLWLLLLQAMVAASLLLIYRTTGHHPGRGEVLCLVFVTTTFFPLAANIDTGGMNPLLLLLLTAAWVAWRHHHDAVAGGLLGSAAIIKIIPLALIPFLAFRRHWRLLLALGVTLGAGVAAGFLLTAADHNLHYYRDLVPHLAAGTGYRENQSIAGLASRLCDPRTAEAGGAAGWCGRALAWPATVLLLASVMSVVRRGIRADLEFALAVCALPLVSSLTWSFHLIVLLLPITLLLRDLFGTGRATAPETAALLLAWACLSIAPVLHFALILNPLVVSGWLALPAVALGRLLAEAPLLGTLILFTALWVRVRKATRDPVTAA